MLKKQAGKQLCTCVCNRRNYTVNFNGAIVSVNFRRTEIHSLPFFRHKINSLNKIAAQTTSQNSALIVRWFHNKRILKIDILSVRCLMQNCFLLSPSTHIDRGKSWRNRYRNSCYVYPLSLSNDRISSQSWRIQFPRRKLEVYDTKSTKGTENTLKWE